MTNPKWAPSQGLAGEVQQIIDGFDGFREWGLRVIHRGQTTVSVGDKLANSWRWEDHCQTDDMLDGVCTIGVDKNSSSLDEEEMLAAFRLLEEYRHLGDKVVLVRGFGAGAGEDDGEQLVSDAEVVKVWAL